MSKEILFDVQAREKIMQGVNILADSVKVTLGPSGKNVMIANGSSAPGEYLQHPVHEAHGAVAAQGEGVHKDAVH